MIITVREMIKVAREHATSVRETMLLDAIEPIYEQHMIIEQLRAPEGAVVSLFCDNPDPGMGANNAFEIVDDWTEWKPRRFEGDTLLEALRAALLAREAK